LLSENLREQLLINIATTASPAKVSTAHSSGYNRRGSKDSQLR
jgi:hypothetical protein